MDKLIEEYKEKGYEIIIVNESDISITFNIIVNINNKKYIEDVEIIKNKIDDVDFLRQNFNYLIHNSLTRYLGGE